MRSFCAVEMDNGIRGCSRGSLIVLEVLDRSGKTSQCGNLLAYLQGKGFSVEAWQFPDRSTSVGKMISAYLANESQLDDRTIHLLFSANRWEKRFDAKCHAIYTAYSGFSGKHENMCMYCLSTILVHWCFTNQDKSKCLVPIREPIKYFLGLQSFDGKQAKEWNNPYC